MGKSRLLIIIAAAIITFATCTIAQTDQRLSSKVTYEAKHKPLKAIVSELSESTGVKLKAGYNDLDWQVRDRRMNIFAKDVPLGELMASIARVMKFKWSKNDDADLPTYRLIADRKMISEMEARQRQMREAQLKAEEAGRQRLVEAVDRVSSMADSDAEKLKGENPYLYLMWKTRQAQVTKAMFDEVPGVREAFVSGHRNIGIPVSLLSSETKQLLLNAVRGTWPYRQSQLGKPVAEFPKPTKDLDAYFGSSLIGIENIPRPFTDWERREVTHYGGPGVTTADGFYEFGDYLDPEAEIARCSAEVSLRSVEQGQTWSQTDEETGHKGTNADEKAVKENDKYLLIDPVLDHPDDPELHKKVKLKIEKTETPDEYERLLERFAAVEKAIAETTGFSVVSDSFTCTREFIDFNQEEYEVGSLLDTFANTYLRNWEKHGQMIEFRRRDWFRKRACQLPDEWLERWRTLLKKNKTLMIDQFAEIATLSFEQIGENFLPDPVLRCCTSEEDWNIIANQSLLQLYKRLSPTQKQMLFAEHGLELRLLPPEQWSHAVDLFLYNQGFSWGDQRFIENPDVGITFTAEHADTSDGRRLYKFTAATQDIKNNREWIVELPKYVEPKEEQLKPVSSTP